MNVVRGWRRDQPLEGRQQRVERRDARGVGVVVRPRRPEMPVRVGAQLLPALVRRVERLEEGDRVGDVDDDRDPELGGGRPQRVEPRVVDGDQPAVRIARAQAERLPDLEPAGAARDRVAQPRRLRLAERGIGRPARRSRGRRRRPRGPGPARRPSVDLGARAPRPGRRRGRRSPRRRTRRAWRPARPRTGPPSRRRRRRRGGCGRRPPGTSACRRGGPAPGATCAAGSRRGGARRAVIPGPG